MRYVPAKHQQERSPVAACMARTFLGGQRASEAGAAGEEAQEAMRQRAAAASGPHRAVSVACLAVQAALPCGRTTFGPAAKCQELQAENVLAEPRTWLLQTLGPTFLLLGIRAFKIGFTGACMLVALDVCTLLAGQYNCAW